MVRNIGRASAWTPVGKRSHSWGRKMNDQIVKFGALLQGAVKSMTTPLPGAGVDGDIYIDPADRRIKVWIVAWNDGDGPIAAEWNVIEPTRGLIMYVTDQNKWYSYTEISGGTWQLLWDPAKTHRAIAREFSFYAPYLIRPNQDAFCYVATKEFTIAAGAPGTGASCEIAPVGGSVVYSIRKNTTEIGTITFAAGSTTGVISFPSEQVILPTIQENMFEQANMLRIRAPANTRSMEGLCLTIAGKIRSID